MITVPVVETNLEIVINKDDKKAPWGTIKLTVFGNKLCITISQGNSSNMEILKKQQPLAMEPWSQAREPAHCIDIFLI